MPAKAGIHSVDNIDPGLRRDDDEGIKQRFLTYINDHRTRSRNIHETNSDC
jgi:hypothetical protein